MLHKREMILFFEIFKIKFMLQKREFQNLKSIQILTDTHREYIIYSANGYLINIFPLFKIFLSDKISDDILK